MKTATRLALIVSSVLLLVLLVTYHVGEKLDKPYVNLGHSEETEYVEVPAVLSGRIIFGLPKNVRVKRGTILAIVRTRLGKGVTARAPVTGEITRVYRGKGHWVDSGDILYQIRPAS